MAFSTVLSGLVWVIFVMPAFSKKGLYFAMTAMVSTMGFPAFGRVSFTILAPKPMVLYFGWITTLEIRIMSWFTSWTVNCFPRAWRLPATAKGGEP